MSAEARTALAAAASTVDGVSCSPYYRQVTKPGQGMVRLDRIAYPSRLGGVATWQIAVWLPSSQSDAEKWMDTHGPDLVEALRGEMSVTSAQPEQLQIDTGLVPAFVVEGTRETEE